MKRYEEYKDSGVQWLEEIPGYWGCVKIKYLCEFINGYAFDSKSFLSEIHFPVARISDIQGGKLDLTNCVYVMPDDKLVDFITHKNDLVIAMSGATTGKTGIVNEEAAYINQRVGIIRSELPYLIKYNLETARFFVYISLSSAGSAQPNISSSGIINYKIPLPPLPEQQAIVSFLDTKTSQIDTYIAGKEKEIDLLKSTKQRIIADAVTKGIKPGVEMKESGISWLGSIPIHWSVKRLGSCFDERREKVSDVEYPALSVSKEGVTPQLADVCKTDNGDNRKKVVAGDFVVNSRSDRKGSCGYSKLTGSVSLINIVLTPRKEIIGEYCHFLFRSNSYIEEFYRNGKGIVSDLWTTNYQSMKTIMIPVPPLPEQRSIVAHIKEKTEAIDAAIEKLTDQIELIKKYKQCLISDVVTGQIKVYH